MNGRSFGTVAPTAVVLRQLSRVLVKPRDSPLKVTHAVPFDVELHFVSLGRIEVGEEEISPGSLRGWRIDCGVDLAVVVRRCVQECRGK